MYNIGVLNQRIFPSNGLVHYWRMDETSGSSIYDTITSGGLTGTVNNATINQTGKNGRSVLLDAANENINFGNNNNLTYNAPVSFSFWVYKTVAISSAGIFFGKYNSTSPTTGYQCFHNGGGDIYFLMTYLGTNLGMGTPTGTIGSTNVWYHIVITYTGGLTANSFEIYVNGVKQTHANNYNGSISSISNSYNFYIGNRYTGSNLSAGGYMDEFAQWNRALTQDEVTAIYNLGTGIYY